MTVNAGIAKVEWFVMGVKSCELIRQDDNAHF